MNDISRPDKFVTTMGNCIVKRDAC